MNALAENRRIPRIITPEEQEISKKIKKLDLYLQEHRKEEEEARFEYERSKTIIYDDAEQFAAKQRLKVIQGKRHKCETKILELKKELS